MHPDYDSSSIKNMQQQNYFHLNHYYSNLNPSTNNNLNLISYPQMQELNNLQSPASHNSTTSDEATEDVFQVAWLRSENHQILDKLNKASDSNDLVLQENVILKEENLELRQVITSMKKLGGAEGGSTSFHERYCSSSLDHDLDQDFSCITNDPKTHHPS